VALPHREGGIEAGNEDVVRRGVGLDGHSDYVSAADSLWRAVEHSLPVRRIATEICVAFAAVAA